MQQSNEFDLVDALDDPSFLKRKKAKALGEISEIMHSAFNTDSGKKALNILSMRYYAHSESNPNDQLSLAARHGERNVLQFIYDQIGAHRG